MINLMIEEKKSVIDQENSENIIYKQAIPLDIFKNKNLASQFICPLYNRVLM